MDLPPFLNDVAAYALGYFYAIVVGTWVITPLLDTFYSGYEGGRTAEKWRSQAVGFVERTLYASSWLSGAPGFAAIWLALKVAGQWERWKADWSSKQRTEEAQARTDTSRAMYAGYLLGNGLSIAFGFVGGMFAQHALAYRWNEAIILAVVPLFGILFLCLFIKRHAAASPPPTSNPVYWVSPPTDIDPDRP